MGCGTSSAEVAEMCRAEALRPTLRAAEIAALAAEIAELRQGVWAAQSRPPQLGDQTARALARLESVLTAKMTAGLEQLRSEQEVEAAETRRRLKVRDLKTNATARAVARRGHAEIETMCRRTLDIAAIATEVMESTRVRMAPALSPDEWGVVMDHLVAERNGDLGALLRTSKNSRDAALARIARRARADYEEGRLRLGARQSAAQTKAYLGAWTQAVLSGPEPRYWAAVSPSTLYVLALLLAHSPNEFPRFPAWALWIRQALAAPATQHVDWGPLREAAGRQLLVCAPAIGMAARHVDGATWKWCFRGV